LFGFLLEKIKIPKIYAALFLGVFLSNSTAVTNITNLKTVDFLSFTGMFSLLFLLGYGLDINKIKKQSKLILKITTYVILTEFVVGTLILHFGFDVDWLLAGVIAVSFATIGEVALLPLLKEFKLINTNLGQTILGVAILDDIVEILAFILMLVFISGFNSSELFSESLPIAAIVSGLILRKMVHQSSPKISQTINILALIVFGPIFFFTAGTEADLNILINNFFVILAFTLAIKTTKLASAYLAAHKQLGTKKSIVLGVSLGIKFSTSIVILIILLQNNLISESLFSILIGIKVVFKFIIPIILSILLGKWQLDLRKSEESY
jgi:Kef-type K+ transport system membrane component KefB